MLKKCLSLFLLLFCLFVSAYSDFSVFLDKQKAALWTMPADEFIAKSRVKFIAQDRKRQLWRYNFKESTDRVFFGRVRVSEILLYTEKNRLTSITITVYNRGDNGIISEKVFKSINDIVEKRLTAMSACSEPETESRKLNDFRIQAVKYSCKEADFVLRRNSRGKRAEYLQVMVCLPGEAGTLRSALKTSVGNENLQLNLNIDGNGDRFLNIPMVNQGKKGYCVAATVERILKYYGSTVDQQIIAQIAESDAVGGTNIETMYKSLHRNGRKLRIDIKTLINHLEFNDRNDFQRFTDVYNKIARKQKRNRIRFKDYSSNRSVNFNKLIGAYEYDVFRDARNYNKRQPEKFKKEIQESIERGIPLVWSTFVFSNTKGGSIGKFSLHMRIINGYNPETGQIIYTDSYGAGHEKKYMNMADAWAITLSLMQITPK